MLFILIGGFVGTLLSSILRAATAGGPISEFFIQEISPGLQPFTLDLVLVSLTLGFSFSFNLLSILGIILAIYLYKQA
ncbi:MAG: DUF4321 domain-containing protein [Nitrospirota bacterium]